MPQRNGFVRLQEHPFTVDAQLPSQHTIGDDTGQRRMQLSSFATQLLFFAAQRYGYSSGHGHCAGVAAQLRSQHCTCDDAHTVWQLALDATHTPLAQRYGDIAEHGHSRSDDAQLESQHCTCDDEHLVHRSASRAHLPVVGQLKYPAGQAATHAAAAMRHRPRGHSVVFAICAHGASWQLMDVVLYMQLSPDVGARQSAAVERALQPTVVTDDEPPIARQSPSEFTEQRSAGQLVPSNVAHGSLPLFGSLHMPRDPAKGIHWHPRLRHVVLTVYSGQRWLKQYPSITEQPPGHVLPLYELHISGTLGSQKPPVRMEVKLQRSAGSWATQSDLDNVREHGREVSESSTQRPLTSAHPL